MKEILKYKIIRQIFISVTALTFFLQGGVLLYLFKTKLDAHEKQKTVIIRDISKVLGEEETKQVVLSLPNYFKLIDQEEDELLFALSVIGMVISIIVGAGSAFIYYHFSGKYLIEITSLNKSLKNKVFTEEEMPSNEWKDLIDSRTKMLRELEDHRNNLSNLLDETKSQIEHTTKLSTIGELTSSIAHDLRNPLQVISSNVEMMSYKEILEDMTPEEILETVEDIKLSISRMDTLLSRMTTFTRNKKDFKEIIPLNEIIDNSLLFVNDKIKKYRVDTSINIEEGIILSGDQDSYEQIFMNLISNACDALQDQTDRSLSLVATQNTDKIMIKVTDSGLGIPKTIQDKIFKSFFTTKEEGKGTGLGLATVQRIVSECSGEISVESELGKGTSFLLTFPNKKIS